MKQEQVSEHAGPAPEVQSSIVLGQTFEVGTPPGGGGEDILSHDPIGAPPGGGGEDILSHDPAVLEGNALPDGDHHRRAEGARSLCATVMRRLVRHLGCGCV